MRQLKYLGIIIVMLNACITQEKSSVQARDYTINIKSSSGIQIDSIVVTTTVNGISTYQTYVNEALHTSQNIESTIPFIEYTQATGINSITFSAPIEEGVEVFVRHTSYVDNLPLADGGRSFIDDQIPTDEDSLVDYSTNTKLLTDFGDSFSDMTYQEFEDYIYNKIIPKSSRTDTSQTYYNLYKNYSAFASEIDTEQLIQRVLEYVFNEANQIEDFNGTVSALPISELDSFYIAQFYSFNYDAEQHKRNKFFIKHVSLDSITHLLTKNLYNANSLDGFIKMEAGSDTLWVSQLEVTNESYRTVLGISEDSYKNRPVADVSFFDAVQYCNELSRDNDLDVVYIYDSIEEDDDGSKRFITDDVEGITIDITKNGYRLPTEREWGNIYENRALRDNQTYFWGESENAESDSLRTQLYVNVTGSVKNVATFYPSLANIYDLSGNVAEMVHVQSGSTVSATSLKTKGGSAASYEGLDIESSTDILISETSEFIGFRVVRNAE